MLFWSKKSEKSDTFKTSVLRVPNFLRAPNVRSIMKK